MSQHAATPLVERSVESVRHNVREVLRVSEQMGNERATADFRRYFDDEASPSEGSLRDIVLLALSHGVSFESDTLAFLLDLSERLTAETDAVLRCAGGPPLGAGPVTINTGRISRELAQLAVLLTDVVAGGETDGASVAAQVWRIDAVAAYERALEQLYVRAHNLASKARRFGLRFLDDSDLKMLVGMMAATQDIGQAPRLLSRTVWLTAITAIGSCHEVSREERLFMIEELATYVLEQGGVSIAANARDLVYNAAAGRPSPSCS